MLAFLDSWWRPVSCLLIAVFPIAALVVFGSSFGLYAGHPLPGMNAGMIAHITLSVLAYGMVAIAALQALALALRGYSLKRRHPRRCVGCRRCRLWSGCSSRACGPAVALLAPAIVSGALSIEDASVRGLTHKTAFSLLSLGLLLALLWGHHRLGWRGFTAVRWTLSASHAWRWLGWAWCCSGGRAERRQLASRAGRRPRA